MASQPLASTFVSIHMYTNLHTHEHVYTEMYKGLSDTCCKEIVYLKTQEWLPTNILQHSSASKETSIW